MEPIEIKEFRNRIGKAIRKLRYEERISARFLAKILGVTQPTISRIENGTTSIAAEKLCFLAKTFNRPLSFFLGEQSPLLHSEEDILRAGLVFYGASHLKSKRTINILQYYRTYSDFLNAALTEIDDPRFAAALATTLYEQALKNNLKTTRIIASIQHDRLIANLKSLVKLLTEAIPNIKRPSKEKKGVVSRISKLNAELNPNIAPTVNKSINSEYIALFINESIGNEQ